MQRITSDTAADLFDISASRRIEQAATATSAPHALMHRAGLAVARLAMAIAPHARTVWIACGPGNNGGDGFEAAVQLLQRGFKSVVTRVGNEDRLPADAHHALQRARAAGVLFTDSPPPRFDLAIDALLGIGAVRPPDGTMADWLRRMHAGPAPVLSVDVPSGLNADTGMLAADFMAHSDGRAHEVRRVCLSLLTLKPGLFTAQGQDAAREVWFDDLGIDPTFEKPAARLTGVPTVPPRRHASHKGSYGDVAVIGGAPGMVGAALLAAQAALGAGAGRVFVAPLDSGVPMFDVTRPELMFRSPQTLDLRAMAVVCGCGGGVVVGEVLPRVLATAHSLVLDADALNVVAADTVLQRLLCERAAANRATVLTPHPLEAARLLGIDTAEVQADRLRAARLLVQRFGATIVLKGSGTVIAADGETPGINLTGNARLATAGTGDVLAGMIGAGLAAGQSPMEAACAAVWQHGRLADRWPSDCPLTAAALARG